MALYRQDVQYGIPITDSPLGFYWCTQVYYWEAADDTAYASARDGTTFICGQSLNTNTLIWSVTVRSWPSGTLVEHFIPPHIGTALSGPFGPAILTVYVSLRSAGRQVSFKRVRSPVRLQDFDDDLSLTPWALAYYQSVFDLMATAGWYRNGNGVPIDQAIVFPRVVSWQLRRGTARRWNQRPLY